MKSIVYLISGIAVIILMLVLNQFIEISDFVRGFCVGLGLSLGIYGLVFVIIEILKERKGKKKEIKNDVPKNSAPKKKKKTKKDKK